MNAWGGGVDKMPATPLYNLPKFFSLPTLTYIQVHKCICWGRLRKQTSLAKHMLHIAAHQSESNNSRSIICG